MTDRTPPFTALRAFEAAARHLSFARAAAELNVTPAALSFQIRTLEEQLGRPVFKRLHRAVELTEAGRALQPGLGEGFAALAAAWRAAVRTGNHHRLTVTAGPVFTSRWLAPRMFDFARAHPEIELRFSASLRFMDFERDEVDVAIRYSSRSDPNLHATPLFTEWMTPMMTPEIAARCGRPEDLAGEVLLQYDDVILKTHPVGWAEWFRAAGCAPPGPGGPRFSQSDHAIEAAMTGAGVVLGRASLALHAISAGQLVAPFPLALTNGTECWLLCAKGTETRPDIVAFSDWIRQEVTRMDELAQGRRFVDATEIER